ncbi:MAG: TolC family protein [Syntrophobacterales bacterium]|jgi:outer membrane protein TolC|nr:TolC family protein [Syntrophobacterales bacterium]
MLALLLFLTLTLTGCATYHPMPLDKAAVDRALAPPALETISLKASQIHHPLLRPVNFDLRDGLSPDEAAILAVIANPRLRALRDQKGLAQAQLIQAGLLPNPQLSYSLDIPMAGATEGTVKAYGLGWSWDIVSLLTRAAKMAAARNQAQAVDLAVAWQEWQVAQAARLQIYRLAFLDQQLAVAKDEEKGLQDNVATVKRALDLGYVTIINLAAAQASLQKVHLQVLTIEQQREQERLALNQALGLPPEQDVPLPAHLEPPSPQSLPSLQEISRNLEERRLDLLALKMGYQSQEERLRAAILAQVPKINIGFAHASDTTHVITTGFAVTIDLPIFDRNQGRIAIETASRQKLFDEYASRLFTARADVARLLTDMASLSQQIKTTENSIPTLSNLVQTYYHALLEGNADVISYYNARDELIARQIQLLTLRRNLADQRIALEIAAGEYLGSGERGASPK